MKNHLTQKTQKRRTTTYHIGKSGVVVNVPRG